MVLAAMVSAVSTASGKASNKVGGALPRLEPKTMDEFDGKYSVGDSVGRGAFAFVLQITDRKTRKQYVVKSIDVSVGYHTVPSWNDAEGLVVDESKMVAAIRECRIWSSLGRSPYCVELLEVFVGRTVVNVVAEICSSSFSRLLHEMHLWPQERISNVFRQMLLGINHVHDAGIVHRDIKPANFLLGLDHKAKLCDFGLARIVPRTTYLSFNLRGTAGTVGYMSPEMFAGHSYGLKTDIWSFGVTAYGLTYALLPFGVQAKTFSEMKQAVLRDEPSYTMPPGRKVPGLLSSRVDFIKSMFQRNPYHRPSAREMLDHVFVAKGQVQDDGGAFEEDVEGPLLPSSLNTSQEPDFIRLTKAIQEDTLNIDCLPTTLLLPQPESPQNQSKPVDLWDGMLSVGVGEELPAFPQLPKSNRCRTRSDSYGSTSTLKGLDHEDSELEDNDEISKISTICSMAPDSPRSPKRDTTSRASLSPGPGECWVWI